VTRTSGPRLHLAWAGGPCHNQLVPELPDIELYLSCLRKRVVAHKLNRVRISSPFVLRTFEPPVEAVEGLTVGALRRIGKRIVFEMRQGEAPAEPLFARGANPARREPRPRELLFIVVHLMIAGRFRWTEKIGVKSAGKIGLANFEFDNGTLMLVEPSQKKRASIHIVAGTLDLNSMDPGGVNVLETDLATFTRRIRAGNHTIKRTLTDPRVFDGIGNAYSDEILHAAKLSPVKLTQKLSNEEIAQLYAASRETLSMWIERLGPIQMHREMNNRLRREKIRVAAELLAEMSHQKRDVAAPSVQRRQLDARHRETVEKVVSEAAGLHLAIEIAPCGCEDPNIDAHDALAADRAKLAALDRS